MPTCGNIEHTSSCSDEQLTITLGSTGSGGEVILDLPQGTQIVDQSGNVVYTVTGDPKKSKLRIP